MKKLLFILLITLPLAVWADSAFELGVRGGITNWHAQTLNGDNKEGTGVGTLPHPHFGAELAFAYYSPYLIGFKTGVTWDHHTASFNATHYNDSYSTTDADDKLMQVDYAISDLHEDYTMTSVGVPVQLLLHTKGLRFCAGGKAVLPLKGSWTERAEKAQLSVFYPEENSRIEESASLAASKEFTEERSGFMQLPKVQWWLSGELTYTFALHKSKSTYGGITVGVYADYCLTPYAHNHSEAESLIMLSDTRGALPLQRIMTPVIEANRQGEPLVNRSTLYDVGIKLAYTLVIIKSGGDDVDNNPDRYGIHRGTTKKYDTGKSDNCNCMR